MIDSIMELFREVNRERFHRIWQKAKKGEMEGLDEEEQRLAKVMLDHSEEFFNQFEFADVLSDRQFDPEEVNPFLHVTLHAVIEKQLKDRDPMEAFQFYNAMLRNKCTRHDAIHLLCGILIKFIFPILKGKGSFSLDGYRYLLKKYKFRKPEKIFDLLEGEPDLIIDKEPDQKNLEIFDEIDSVLSNQNFTSIDEAQAFLDDLMAKKNLEPIPEFLGLSPDQMYRMLYRPFTEHTDILTFNRNLSDQDFKDIPILKETRYFLKRLSELQPLKATAKGNLPQAFAREMHDKFSEEPRSYIDQYPIRSEEEDRKLLALRQILDMAGWIKKRNQKFSLTQKGERVVKRGLKMDDFYYLFEIYTKRFNWAYRDLYPNLEIIQESFLFSCYLLHKKARAYIRADKLSSYFIQAFPTVLDEAKINPFFKPEEDVSRAFCLRFLERFCEYFGLVVIKREDNFFDYPNYFVQISPFFEKLFHWRPDLT
jgi:hypothetical protein